MKLRRLRFMSACLGALFAVAVQSEPLPVDSGALNVRDFGAKGDGVHDDTAAIKEALVAAQVDQGKGFWPAKIVYFPAGTYRVTDTLEKRDAQQRPLSSMSLVGESRDKVRIKLDDEAAGYREADRPKAVIYTSSSLLGGSPTAGGKDYLGKGEGNDAYGNYIEDMTIDVGRRNPGAVGIDYMANNIGAIRNVRILAGEGSGSTGLSMERKWPGPLLVIGVSIEGFARGIAVRYREYSVTLENVQLKGQTDVAIRNDGNSLAMRNIDIETAAVGLQNISPDGLIVADQLTVKLTKPRAAWAENRGYMTFKGVRLTQPGHTAPPEDGMPTKDGAYKGTSPLPGFDAGWQLKGIQPPAAWQPPLERWANVVTYGAKPDSGEDATEAIRAAMASGAEAVYFPSGRYLIRDAIEIPAKVRRIAGMLSSISTKNRLPSFARNGGMFRVTTAGQPLTIDRLGFDNTGQGPQVAIEHSGERDLVLRDLLTFAVAGVDRKVSGGRLFIENTTGGSIGMSGRAGVWVRQLNTEGPNVRIRNLGSPLSILGLKSEQNATMVENESGAQTEVLGGLLYLVHPPKERRPAFVNHDGARLTAAYVESAYLPNAFYEEHFVELAPDGSKGSIAATQLPSRGMARIVPGVVLTPSGANPMMAPAR